MRHTYPLAVKGVVLEYRPTRTEALMLRQPQCSEIVRQQKPPFTLGWEVHKTLSSPAISHTPLQNGTSDSRR